jgi:hypothetical protein
VTRFLGIGLLTFVLIALGAGCDFGNQPEPVGTGPVELEEATAVPSNPTATTEPIEPTNTPPETSGEGNADVLFVSATETAVGLWTFSVEVAHPDTGWEDYADGWDVVLPDGTVAKANPDDQFTRLLLHPHENEQPFTRSQNNIPIPPEVTTVTVRAHDLVDRFGGQEVVVDLTAVSGENFEVNR